MILFLKMIMAKRIRRRKQMKRVNIIRKYVNLRYVRYTIKLSVKYRIRVVVCHSRGREI